MTTPLSRAIAAATFVLLSSAEPATATKRMQNVFLDVYVKGDGASLPELKGKEACLYCHQGKKRKNNNPYGEALGAHLDKKDKDVEKIAAALETVAAESSNADDESAPTWGELIASGELPGGPLEEVREEPGG